MAEADLDSRVGARASQLLKEQTELHGDEVLPREVLAKGFEFEGQRVPLIAPQGIFKPAVLAEVPLSITTVPVVEGEGRPYDDGVEGRVVSRPPGLTARGRASSVRPSHAPAYSLGVE
jgi:hypothetical protein